MGSRGGAHYIQVVPRYTCGSPAAVVLSVAEGVARDERQAYAFILGGLEGDKAKARAEVDGLRLIVFEMIEVGKVWAVHDWLTGEMHVWPFEGTCPKCGEKRVSLRRGNLTEHGCPFNFGGYVGRPVNEEERIKYGRRFLWPLSKELG